MVLASSQDSKLANLTRLKMACGFFQYQLFAGAHHYTAGPTS
jgi:hypothetical protein